MKTVELNKSGPVNKSPKRQCGLRWVGVGCIIDSLPAFFYAIRCFCWRPHGQFSIQSMM